jgi:alkylglycerol monooxygenase
MINTFALLMPVFLLIVLIEWYVSNKKQDNKYNTGNIMMNLTIGAIDQIGSLFYFVCLYVVLDYMYVNYRLVTMQENWQQWVMAYIIVDFVSYWYHRWSHRINILWAGHITHHSSELYNFSNGFRTSLFQGLNRIIFWSIMPIFGFSPAVLVITLKVSGLYDFLVHTEYIPKLGFLEKIFITPSLHRVHHGKNDIYIDKNYGSTFLIWDQLFGTYQPETEKVQYGVKGSYLDNNPFKAIGYHYVYLFKTMLATNSWRNKIKLLFMPPEWQPTDLVLTETSVSFFETPVEKPLKNYAIFQMVSCVLGMVLLLTFKNFLTNWELLLCASIGIISMANATMVYKKNCTPNFINVELIRLGVAFLLLSTTILFVGNYYLLFPLIFILFGFTYVLYLRASDKPIEHQIA